MSTIYEIIDQLCAEKGISGSKMCDDLGMSRSTLTELRKGRAKTLKLEKASKIADYFGRLHVCDVWRIPRADGGKQKYAAGYGTHVEKEAAGREIRRL